MTQFNRPRHVWGRRQPPDAPPAALLTEPASRACLLAPEAQAVLEHLPAPGAALHVILTGRFDLMQIVVALAARLGKVEAMRVSTLSFHAVNLAAMLGLLDRGQVKKLSLLACTFFRNTNRALFVQTQEEFRQRSQLVAAARTHAKIVTLDAGGDLWAIEGSANLRFNDCWENVTLVRDPAVHAFHAGWIDEMVAKHEGDPLPTQK